MRYKKETKKIRKATIKRYRRLVKLSLKEDKEISRFKRTEGWLTW